MAYWDRFDTKAQAFDKIIGREPRLKRTPFVFGGAMVLSRELFECVPFDPLVTRGEDIDYLINGKMYGFSFFLDNTLSIKHLPQPQSHPQWKRMREDIYRFVYQREKMLTQTETSNMVLVYPEDFDPYPGAFLKDDLDDKIFRGSLMLATEYTALGDTEGCRQALENIHIAKYDAKPKFDAFETYRNAQRQWDTVMQLVRKNRYALRAILERRNLSGPEVFRDEAHIRRMTASEILREIRKIPLLQGFTEDEIAILSEVCQIKTYYEKERIFSAGDFNDAAHIVLKGRIRLFAPDNSDTESVSLTIAYLNKGDLLGESCLIYNTFRLSGTAEEFTELLYIRKNDLNSLIEAHPALGVKLLKLMLEGAADKMERANDSVRMSAQHSKYVVQPSDIE